VSLGLIHPLSGCYPAVVLPYRTLTFDELTGAVGVRALFIKLIGAAGVRALFIKLVGGVAVRAPFIELVTGIHLWEMRPRVKVGQCVIH